MASVPHLARHFSKRTIIGGGLILWILFFLGRVFGHNGTGPLAAILEIFGMNWMGILFLLFVSLLAADLATGFGMAMPRLARSLRGYALIIAILLSVFALIQGNRSPVVQDYEVRLSGLPAELEGKVIMAMSDMHLGSVNGEAWLKERIDQVRAGRPDLVVLLGDILEGHGPVSGAIHSALGRLSAPLGVWAVPGNHESHGDAALMRRLMEEAGFRVLQNRWEEAVPGLILAGLEDLTARQRTGQTGDVLTPSLSGRPPGVTVLLSHTPWQADQASALGAGLMLSGHTHGGQIWPFRYVISLLYPLVEGRYEVAGMVILVCRGTGTWGPRMRLWRPGEIMRITLMRK